MRADELTMNFVFMRVKTPSFGQKKVATDIINKLFLF
jgi:hypothetical protein